MQIENYLYLIPYNRLNLYTFRSLFIVIIADFKIVVFFIFP